MESSTNPTPEEDKLNSPLSMDGLKKFNKQLGYLADKLTAKGELNGLFLLGLGTQLASTGIHLLTREAKDQQEAGMAIIKRFEQILPERIQGDSLEPFVWKQPNSEKTYRFELSGGEPSKEKGKIGKTPKVLRGVELQKDGKEKEVFLATKQDPDSQFPAWRIEQCDFSQKQIESLTLARRQIDIERSPVNKTAQSANSFCL
jgi:hypothetical protein